MDRIKKANKLVNEKSPYLLQHAHNPVDWYPWGEEAFSKARIEQKPIFLSVGYSTCHWCHVMEHESFENDSIASLLNSYFVSIKVDREERPDIDKVYMAALQGMGQSGGWPMSMFLTPELKPFYGGTYFPPRSQYGRIGFPDLLERIHQVWTAERERVQASADGVMKALREMPPSATTGPLNESLKDTCFHQFERSFDPEFGGFGGAPKFPRPSVFNFLLRYYARTGNAKALDMTALTSQKMSAGGIYDHIGGGFHRYSVDREWRVPHFEKMLYDQAQLVCSCLDLFQITSRQPYATVSKEVLDYVLRDMTHPKGGFFSAEDADSPKTETPEETGEGAFYVWMKKEIFSVLGQEDAKVFCFHYGVEDGGNAPFDPQHEFTGTNILYAAHSFAETASFFNDSENNTADTLERSRADLFKNRSQRPRPHLDDKVLTSWNGLMISALARAGVVLHEAKYVRAAEHAAGFIVTHMLDGATGQLSRRYRDGESKYEGNLDDYAFFTQGLLDLYEATFDVKWLQLALKLTRTQISVFWDSTSGGFFDTSGKDASVLIRMKEQYDGAEPTGNSMAVMNLLRLSEITGDDELRQKAERTFQSVGEILQKQPAVMPQMAAAYDFFTAQRRQIVIVGPRNDSATRDMLEQVYSRYLPNKIIVLLDGENQIEIAQMNPFYGSLSMKDGRPTTYVCENYACQLPTTDPEVVAKLLDDDKR